MEDEVIVPAVEEEEPRAVTAPHIRYKDFLTHLMNNIHNSLNPPNEKRIAFVCLIFPIDGIGPASLISNVQHREYFPILRKYTSRLQTKLRKRKAN